MADLAGVDVDAVRAATSAPAAWPPRSTPRAIATSEGIPVLLGRGRRRSAAALAGDGSARCSTPAGGRSASRLFWLRHATTPRGRLVLDAGAVEAVVQRRTSLLPAGVTAVSGEFYAGDPVELVGRTVGRRPRAGRLRRRRPAAAARAQDRRPAGRVPPRGRAPRRPRAARALLPSAIIAVPTRGSRAVDKCGPRRHRRRTGRSSGYRRPARGRRAPQ